MKELIYNFFYDSAMATTPMSALINMGIALALAVVICLTYWITFSGVAYSKKFNMSLMMLTLVTPMTMNILGSNLALSLGMVGALSIVRFRTAIKDPRDTAYIFWTISAGLGAGSANYIIVIVGTLVLSAVSIISQFFVSSDENYLVIIRGSSNCTNEVRASLFAAYRAGKLRAETITDDYTEIVYQVKFRKAEDIGIYEMIKNIDGVSSVNVVSKNGEVLG